VCAVSSLLRLRGAGGGGGGPPGWTGFHGAQNRNKSRAVVNTVP
jgi:hypothetical protein